MLNMAEYQCPKRQTRLNVKNVKHVQMSISNTVECQKSNMIQHPNFGKLQCQKYQRIKYPEHNQKFKTSNMINYHRQKCQTCHILTPNMMNIIQPPDL